MVLTLTWRNFEKACRKLAYQIRCSYDPECILAIARGGLIVSVRLSHMLDVRCLAFTSVEYYREPGVKAGRPKLEVPPTGEYIGKRVLLVDDIIDTGDTVKLIIDLLRGKIRDLRIAALTFKPWSSIKPNYYGFGPVKEWVVFPWEIK